MLADATRNDVLAAMGIEVWRLRGRSKAQANNDDSDLGHSARDTTHGVVLVCAANLRRATQHRRFFDGVARTFGIPYAALRWLEAAADGSLAAPDNATAYVIFGDALTRHFGAHLSAQRQSEVTIAVCAEPAGAMRDASSKRLLWQALKPVARHLRGATG